MTTNLYMNDYGAINEGMSDIVGNLVEMILDEDEEGDWELGEDAGDVMRSMSNPNEHEQPAFFWDRYYVPGVLNPSDNNDQGGVHTNSSLLNILSSKLYEAGLTEEEQIYYWLNVALAMTPRTDFAQLAELLPWCLYAADYPEYEDALREAIDEAGYNDQTLPEIPVEGCGMAAFVFPSPQTEESMDVVVSFYDPSDGSEVMTWPEAGTEQVAAMLPEGDYVVLLNLISREDGSTAAFVYTVEYGWNYMDEDISADIFNEEGTPEVYLTTIEEGERTELETESLEELLAS